MNQTRTIMNIRFIENLKRIHHTVSLLMINELPSMFKVIKLIFTGCGKIFNQSIHVPGFFKLVKE